MGYAETAQRRNTAHGLSYGPVVRSISAYLLFGLSVAFTAGLVVGVIH